MSYLPPLPVSASEDGDGILVGGLPIFSGLTVEGMREAIRRSGMDADDDTLGAQSFVSVHFADRYLLWMRFHFGKLTAACLSLDHGKRGGEDAIESDALAVFREAASRLDSGQNLFDCHALIDDHTGYAQLVLEPRTRG